MYEYKQIWIHFNHLYRGLFSFQISKCWPLRCSLVQIKGGLGEKSFHHKTLRRNLPEDGRDRSAEALRKTVKHNAGVNPEKDISYILSIVLHTRTHTYTHSVDIIYAVAVTTKGPTNLRHQYVPWANTILNDLLLDKVVYYNHQKNDKNSDYSTIFCLVTVVEKLYNKR